MATDLQCVDTVSQELLKWVEQGQIAAVLARFDAMQSQRESGASGFSCQRCGMGMCRIALNGTGQKVGVCGADADTLTAWDLAQMVAAGATRYAEQCRQAADLLLHAAEHPGEDATIKNPDTLSALAGLYEIPTGNREIHDIARAVAHAILTEFGRPYGYLRTTAAAPAARQKIWQTLDIMPRAIDREVVELLRQTTQFTDGDYVSILKQSLRAALAAVWGSSLLAVLLRDVVFGQPAPTIQDGMVTGFTAEAVFGALGGTYRATYRPLNNALIEGRIRGLAGLIGDPLPDSKYEDAILRMAQELIKNDVLVAAVGGAALTCGKQGLLQPEAADQYAGKGLQEVCYAVGLPPVLHFGSSIDVSRIVQVLLNIIAEGGLGDDLSDLPVAGAAPAWVSADVITTGFCLVASGVYTMLCQPLPMALSPNVAAFLTQGVEPVTGGKVAIETDPVAAAQHILRHIDKKRKALKLKPMLYTQAFQPEE